MQKIQRLPNLHGHSQIKTRHIVRNTQPSNHQAVTQQDQLSHPVLSGIEQPEELGERQSSGKDGQSSRIPPKSYEKWIDEDVKDKEPLQKYTQSLMTGSFKGAAAVSRQPWEQNQRNKKSQEEHVRRLIRSCMAMDQVQQVLIDHRPTPATLAVAVNWAAQIAVNQNRRSLQYPQVMDSSAAFVKGQSSILKYLIPHMTAKSIAQSMWGLSKLRLLDEAFMKLYLERLVDVRGDVSVIQCQQILQSIYEMKHSQYDLTKWRGSEKLAPMLSHVKDKVQQGSSEDSNFSYIGVLPQMVSMLTLRHDKLVQEIKNKVHVLGSKIDLDNLVKAVDAFTRLKIYDDDLVEMVTMKAQYELTRKQYPEQTLTRMAFIIYKSKIVVGHDVVEMLLSQVYSYLPRIGRLKLKTWLLCMVKCNYQVPPNLLDDLTDLVEAKVRDPKWANADQKLSLLFALEQLGGNITQLQALVKRMAKGGGPAKQFQFRSRTGPGEKLQDASA